MPKLYYVTDLLFECMENPITIGDDKFRVEAPFDGEILGNRLGPRIGGHILDGGTGAGTATQVQIRNVTKGRDYFTALPEFAVDDEDASRRCVLSGGVLGTFQKFNQGDVLALDIDGVPGGANSDHATIWLTVGMWREVD